MSGSLICLVLTCVAKSRTANPLKPPNWAYTLSVEPSGFFVTAIGEGAGLIGIVQVISLVRVSTTLITFAGGFAPRLFPTSTYFPSAATFGSWTPPLMAMVLTIANQVGS